MQLSQVTSDPYSACRRYSSDKELAKRRRHGSGQSHHHRRTSSHGRNVGTELCSLSVCKRTECAFAHALAELRPKNISSWQYKTQACRYDPGCGYGKRCQFIHDGEWIFRVQNEPRKYFSFSREQMAQGQLEGVIAARPNLLWTVNDFACDLLVADGSPLPSHDTRFAAPVPPLQTESLPVVEAQPVRMEVKPRELAFDYSEAGIVGWMSAMGIPLDDSEVALRPVLSETWEQPAFEAPFDRPTDREILEWMREMGIS